MARAQALELAAAPDELLHLLKRFRAMQPGRAIGVIASPIALLLTHLSAPISLGTGQIRRSSSACSIGSSGNVSGSGLCRQNSGVGPSTIWRPHRHSGGLLVIG